MTDFTPYTDYLGSLNITFVITQTDRDDYRLYLGHNSIREYYNMMFNLPREYGGCALACTVASFTSYYTDEEERPSQLVHGDPSKFEVFPRDYESQASEGSEARIFAEASNRDPATLSGLKRIPLVRPMYMLYSEDPSDDELSDVE